ncbi:MAG: hypothetical protein ONB44_21810 [candidate division KSB1 bacterium]|nr:hypothetical protein [candidate division KSB1 bacterium]MDZ7304774.1 hypothetical protein [candidate division KSB1 bacterium]MDZ7314437.1 hypothetical protein [candidate division KSB1 bacterium]
MKTKKTFFSMFVLPWLFFQNVANAQTPAGKADWFSLNMGFAITAAANTMVKSAAGQAFVGAMQNSSTQIESGFLAHLLLRDPTTSVSEKGDALEIPSANELQQNYPNPLQVSAFNPSTTIKFSLPKPSAVTFKLLDIIWGEIRLAREVLQIASTPATQVGFHQREHPLVYNPMIRAIRVL